MSKESRFRVPGLPGSPFTAALVPAFVASLAASAALAAWAPAGAPLVTTGGAQSSVRAVTDGRGGFIAAWIDTNGGSPRILAQRVDSTGATQWTAGGVVVTTNSDSLKQLVAAPDGQNGMLLAWTARRAPARYQVFVQRLAAATGSALWTPGGMRADPASNDTLQGQPAIIASDLGGGAFVAWSENRGATDYDVYVQRINADSTREWTTGGVDVADTDTDDQVNARLLSDGNGGAWVSWEDASATPHTYLQRYNDVGTEQWTAGGVTPTNGGTQSLAAFMGRLRGVSDTLLVAWSEPGQVQGRLVTPVGGFLTANQLRNASVVPFGLHMQSSGSAILFTANATTVSAVGVSYSAQASTVPLTVASGQTLNASSSPNSVGDGGSGAFAVWASGGSAYARHVTPAVANDWGAPVALGQIGSPAQTYPVGVAGGDLLAAWVDARNAGSTGDDLFMQRVSPSGVTGTYYRINATVAAAGTGAFSAGGGRTWVHPGDSLRVVYAGTGSNYVSQTIVGATTFGPVPNYTFRNIAGDSTLQASFSSAAVTLQVAAPASAYRAFALPFIPAPASIASTFANLMPYDPVRWRLGHWRADDSTYRDPSGLLTSLAVGEGYWFIGLKDTTLSFTGSPAPESQFNLTMLGKTAGKGWTQFGSPFRFPLAVSQLRVSPLPNAPISDAGNLFTDHQVLTWNPGTQSYVAVSVLLPGQAYWLYRDTSLAVTLRFPFEWNPVATAGLAPSLTADADWSVGVTARAGERRAQLDFGAAWAGNRLSAHAPPAVPGDGLSLVARGADGDYRAVFVPDAAELRYEFDASAPAGLAETALTFAFDRLPADRRVVLSEPATGWSREVSADASVPLVLSANVRHFRLEVLAGAPVTPRTPLATALRAVGPNPFHDTATLSFSIAHAGPLRWDVFDLAGRRVAAGARTLDVGEHTLTWDGRDAAGVRVRPGLYLVRWQADGAAGAARLVLTD